MKRKRSSARRMALGFGLIALLFAAMGLFLAARPAISKARLLQEFHLPVWMVFDVEDYSYWNDFLKYTDGYEILEIDVEAGRWKTPDIWNVGETTVFEILRPYGLGFSSALRDEIESGNIPLTCQEWFVSEKKPNGNYDGWEFFIGSYDGNERLFLYRGHHLYGDADLRLTGE